MGNTYTSKRSKKDPVVQQQSSNSNIVRGTVLSNVPGTSAPPTFVKSQETDDKPNSHVNLNDKPNEKNQIDSLPRHTAGSAELVRTIAVNREKAIQKSASDESKDLDSLNLDQYFQEPLSKIKPQSSKQEQRETHDNDNKPYDPEVSVSSHKVSSYLNSLAEIDKQNPTENQTTNTKSRRSHKERRRRPRPDDHQSSSSDRESLKDDIKYSSLNQKKNRLYKDLISLNQIENNQKRKILEQERELKIQNMKLNDALLVKKCVKNFQPIDANDDEGGGRNGLGEGGYTRVPSYTYKNANRAKDKRPRSAMASNQKPSIRFPTIITKYEPQTYSKHAAGKSRPSNDTVDLYLETIEDLVDASGQIISTKQSFKFIGKTAETSKSDLEPKVIYEHHSPINDMDLAYVTYPRMSSVYESSRHGGSLQKLTTSQLGAYEVITVDPNESKISRTVGGDATLGLSQNYSKHLTSPSRLVSRELSIDSPKTQLDDSEIKEILRIVDEKQRKMPSNHYPSKYGIHRLSDNASLLEKRIRATSCRTETPKASARIVDNKSSPMTKSVNYSYLDDNFVLASGPSSYTIQRQPVQQSKPLGRNRSMLNQQPNVLRTQSLRTIKPELSSTIQASAYLNTDSTQSIIRTVNEMKDRDSAAKKPGFKSIATDTANNQLNHPIKNQVFKSIYQMEKSKPRESTISLSPHRSTFAFRSNVTTQNQNEKVDLKTIDYSTTNIYHDQRYMLRKLAQAKDGDFIVKDKANENVWNPSFLSAIPNNFDVNANDTTGTFDWKGYLESYSKEMKPTQEQPRSNPATGTFDWKGYLESHKIDMKPTLQQPHSNNDTTGTFDWKGYLELYKKDMKPTQQQANSTSF